MVAKKFGSKVNESTSKLMTVVRCGSQSCIIKD